MKFFTIFTFLYYVSFCFKSNHALPTLLSSAYQLDRTLGEFFGPNLSNFTRTPQQVASCYLDPLDERQLNIFNTSLSVRTLVSHYYNAFPQKQMTPKSIVNLLNSTKQIITICLDPNRSNPLALFGFTSLSDLDRQEINRLRGIPSADTLRPLLTNSSGTKRQASDDFDRAECSANEISYIPTRFDWRDRGVVTRPKRQTCASCYIYAAVGAIESAMLVHRKTTRTDRTLDLSEEQLEDCTVGGCDGGFAEEAFDYVLKNGIAYEDRYQSKYQSHWDAGMWFSGYRDQFDEPKCNQDATTRLYPLKGYCVKTYRTQVGERTIPDHDIQQHLLKFGPLYVATSTNYYDIVGGVVDDPGCTARGYLNHAVLLVGYDEHTWIIKNSFGSFLYDDGFYRIRRGNRNICGINTEIAFPLV